MPALVETAPLGEARYGPELELACLPRAGEAAIPPFTAPCDRSERSFWEDLRLYFGIDFSVWDGVTGERLRQGPDQPSGDEAVLSAILPAVAHHARPQFVGDEDCAVLLAIPWTHEQAPPRVAVGAFVLRRVEPGEGISPVAWLLGMTPVQARAWLDRQALWRPESLLHLATAIVEKYAHRRQTAYLAGFVRAMAAAIDAKDHYTSGHSERVARVAVRLAQELGWDGPRQNTVYLAGILHDIGKLRIDEGILKKPRGLTEREYAHIRRHPLMGHRILAAIRPLSAVRPAVLFHHERWDGRGYPAGRKGAAIPELARIVAVADSYDAMISNRPYRAGLPADRVSRIFREDRGRHWDPRVIDAFFAIQDELAESPRGPGRHRRSARS